MDLEKVKAQIAELKDKVVDNVDKYFNDEILLDVFDSGEFDIIDKPIDEMDWYLYWKQQAYDLREIFYYLFNQKQNKTVSSLLNDCVELKKVIDKNLLSNPHYNFNDLMEWFGVEVDVKTHKNYIPLTNDKLLNSKIVNTLHENLLKAGFIESDFDQFNTIFSLPTSNPVPIKWFGTEIQIIALFDSMISLGIIPKTLIHRLSYFITTFFINKLGNEFKDKQIVVVKSNLIKSKDSIQIVTEIVNKLVVIN